VNNSVLVYFKVFPIYPMLWRFHYSDAVHFISSPDLPQTSIGMRMLCSSLLSETIWMATSQSRSRWQRFAWNKRNLEWVLIDEGYTTLESYQTGHLGSTSSPLPLITFPAPGDHLISRGRIQHRGAGRFTLHSKKSGVTLTLKIGVHSTCTLLSGVHNGVDPLEHRNVGVHRYITCWRRWICLLYTCAQI
jgi:hypothetical protein